MMHHDIPTMQLTVDPLCVDHQSAPPPESTEAIAFSCKSKS